MHTLIYGPISIEYAHTSVCQHRTMHMKWTEIRGNSCIPIWTSSFICEGKHHTTIEKSKRAFGTNQSYRSIEAALGLVFPRIPCASPSLCISFFRCSYTLTLSWSNRCQPGSGENNRGVRKKQQKDQVKKIKGWGGHNSALPKEGRRLEIILVMICERWVC